MKFLIRFEKISDVKDFVKITSECNCDVIIKSEKYTVDGKSIMGIFSLDLAKPLTVEINGEISNDIANQIQKYRVLETE